MENVFMSSVNDRMRQSYNERLIAIYTYLALSVETKFLLQPTLRASKQIHGKKSKAPPPLQHSKMVLLLSIVEKLIMESVGYDDVNNMYSKIKVFMKQENILGKKNIFTNIYGIFDEEAKRSVGKFLMHG